MQESKRVIQPGGSIKDQDSIDYCNAHGMAMALIQVSGISNTKKRKLLPFGHKEILAWDYSIFCRKT